MVTKANQQYYNEGVHPNVATTCVFINEKERGVKLIWIDPKY